VSHLHVLLFLIGSVLMLIQLALALVALIRCDRADLPAVVQALASWWHWPIGPRR
jgi:hypothetical protein